MHFMKKKKSKKKQLKKKSMTKLQTGDELKNFVSWSPFSLQKVHTTWKIVR